MFFHEKELQYLSKPDRPDPIFARQLQEVLGGQFGEISVAMQYLFQGWNVRGNGKYKDLLMDTGTEELKPNLNPAPSYIHNTLPKNLRTSSHTLPPSHM